MIINFIKLSPGGNTTAIILSEVAPQARPYVANLLMSADYLAVEQVGFLEPPTKPEANARIDMMGGELCINAIRSVSAFLLKLSDENTDVLIESTGTAELLRCSNAFLDNGKIFTSIQWEVMPKVERLDDTAILVELPGITHILCKKEELPSKDETGKLFSAIQEKYSDRLMSQPAYGIIPYAAAGEAYRIRPVVFVRKTESTVFETGCGSGSIALALSKKNTERNLFRVIQPSGAVYEVSLSPKLAFQQVLLGSPVDIIIDGKVYITL